jgi:glucose/arabinose dehydrogenase
MARDARKETAMTRRFLRRSGAAFVAAAIALSTVASAPVVSRVAPTARSAADTTEPVPQALATGQVQFKLVASGLSAPLGIVNAGDGSSRLFIVQRGGTIRVVLGNKLQPGSFMDISSKVRVGSERGLLGLAFHPDFETNRRLFVFYTRASDGDIVIARYLADPGLATVNEASEVILLTIEHTLRDNHNGGQLAFGPDGYLYAAVGDGGGAFDPDNNGQDKGVLLGKLLRLNVDGTGSGPNNAYGIPAGNPFAGATTGLDEIWDFGLRNPWRFSFDRQTDELWIADVGQGAWEEVNREATGAGGKNYGWDDMEGKHCAEAGCSSTGKTLPIAEYSHSFGCSVTGGYVYRGASQQDLVGHYVLADYCSGRIWTIAANSTALVFQRTYNLRVTSFGESETGELYAVDLSGGRLYRVVAPEFSDILNSQFLDDIHWLLYSGITAGCGGTRFCPTASVTREQMASFLARALKLPPTTQDFFSDDETSIHEQNINRIAAAGITTGCGGGRFCPRNNVTRAEFATFMVNALDLPPTATDYFTDDETSSHEPNINAFAKAGLTSGCGGGRYCPTQAVTREQMAAFLRRAFD